MGVSIQGVKWLSVKEAAEYTGYCTESVYRAARNGKLRAGHGGTGRGKGALRGLRFKTTELDRWVERAAA